MSTRSEICIVDKNGKVRGIYCHFDGYLSGVGKTLKNYYKDEKTVNKLIDLGDISTLGKKIDPDPSKEHNFDNRQKDVTTAYHRDRGEPLSIDKAKSLDELIRDIISNSTIEYLYIFKNGKWHYRVCSDDFDDENLV